MPETDTSLAYADASVFVGMHSPDERRRVACKNFFVDRLTKRVCMSLENIGACDAIVWALPPAIQDAYYPFMDVLHTVAEIDRLPYTEDDLRTALEDVRLRPLAIQERLSVAMVMNTGCVLFTTKSSLLERADLPVRPPAVCSVERAFPPVLEELYQKSLPPAGCAARFDVEGTT